ncbi:hypothetical protein Poly21_39980 [Allorhodopirellula heiligendammensis]|uniref:Uncharacterized protein n=1 Tax=Allorhodopirellula heiligendammensis TaxID=2714739 RepID=A0A5C6BZE3_9BACT|nr:hypothetical protein Poly21_39980 [Allorhodopirellula heiligendammensis]
MSHDFPISYVAMKVLSEASFKLFLKKPLLR